MQAITLLDQTDGSKTILKVYRKEHFSELEHIAAASKYVFCDHQYREIELEDDADIIEHVELSINGNELQSVVNNNHIYMLTASSEAEIFFSCYGFTSLELKLHSAQKTEEYITEPVSIMVKDNYIGNSLRRMYSYVEQHEPEFIRRYDNQLSAYGIDTYNSKIRVAEKTLKVYKDCYGYFRENARYKIHQEEIVDRAERMQHINASTVRYAVTHPEYLHPSNTVVGIPVGDKYYIPRKVLTSRNVITQNIYENQMVVSFLTTLMKGVSDIETKIHKLTENVNALTTGIDGYINSAIRLYGRTQEDLRSIEEKCRNIQKELRAVYMGYRTTFDGVDYVTIEQAVKMTPIFMTVPQYNMIFNNINEWLYYGTSREGTSDDGVLLTTFRSSGLYEEYVLSRLLVYFKEKAEYIGRTLVRYQHYDEFSDLGTDHSNVFLFKTEKANITVFFQPIIGKPSEGDNIGIYRSVSWTFDFGSRSNESYYSPDYVVKIDAFGMSKFIILDAKFSKNTTVKKQYLMNLIYKYLFSVETTNVQNEIAGMGILFGRTFANDEYENIHDREIIDAPVHPYTKMIPLSESILDSELYSYFDDLFNVFEERIL